MKESLTPKHLGNKQGLGGNLRPGRLAIKTKFVIRRFQNEEAHKRNTPYNISEFESNIGLNEGIEEAWKLIIGAAATAFNNANAQTGVGDSAAGEDPIQTDLQAAVNKTYKGMDATYPLIAGAVNTRCDFRSTYVGGDANYAWAEFIVRNGAVGLKDLIRKVSAQGTKTAGQVWELTIQITMS